MLAEGGPWEVAVLLSTTTGARRGEVLGLTWDDVDLDAGRLRISRGLQRQAGSMRYCVDLRFLCSAVPL